MMGKTFKMLIFQKLLKPKSNNLLDMANQFVNELLTISKVFLAHLSHSDKVSFCDRSLSVVPPSVVVVVC